MTLFGSQVKEVALATRMFASEILPWECDHTFVGMPGLGRTWSTCSSCGYLEHDADRALLMRWLSSS